MGGAVRNRAYPFKLQQKNSKKIPNLILIAAVRVTLPSPTLKRALARLIGFRGAGSDQLVSCLRGLICSGGGPSGLSPISGQGSKLASPLRSLLRVVSSGATLDRKLFISSGWGLGG